MRIKPVIFFTLLLLFSIFLNLSIGSTYIDLQTLWDTLCGVSDNGTASIVIIQYRIPKTLTAILTGVAMSVSGLIMQTVFRNPLADPYILGISSGAGFGVALTTLGASSLGIFGFLENFAVITSALIGAAAVLLLLVLISLRVKDIMTILILGMLFGTSISAIIGVMQYFSPESALKAYVIWTMGSLGAVTHDRIIWLTTTVALGFMIILLNTKQLNMMLTGENYALTSGMNITAFRLSIFSATCLMTGGITAFCGPIGFIGIMIPHLARIVSKTTDHKVLIINSSLLGASVMLIADTIAQLPGSTGVLPINSVTALLGIPVVIWIVLKNHKMNTTF